MHPYKTLPKKAFWRSAVASQSFFDIRDLWTPKFEINNTTRTATYGSCFAQHFGHALRARGFPWINLEPAPQGLSEENAKLFNYGLFSSRTGNIYTTSLLLQWLGWAAKKTKRPDEYWEKDGRIFDPFRPNVEPDGFESVEEMLHLRNLTINAFYRSVRNADMFVFTLGLTESWVNKDLGYEYPMCPGTIAGKFDAEKHIFVAQSYEQIAQNLTDAIELMREINPKIKVLLTVSPVPLTATNTGEHVLVATSLSKSILRAVTDNVLRRFNFVDYFPSYEIINSPVYRGAFFEPNLRQVNPAGVELVMKNFFYGLGEPETVETAKENQTTTDTQTDKKAQIVCEEEFLSAYGLNGEENE